VTTWNDIDPSDRYDLHRDTYNDRDTPPPNQPDDIPHPADIHNDVPTLWRMIPADQLIEALRSLHKREHDLYLTEQKRTLDLGSGGTETPCHRHWRQRNALDTVIKMLQAAPTSPPGSHPPSAP
jgi:hypothetical protein